MDSRPRCGPTVCPPFRISTLVAMKRPPPASTPVAMPQARVFSWSRVWVTCRSWSFMARRAPSYVVQEIAGRLAGRPHARGEQPRREEEVATEGEEPPGDE